MRRLIVISVLVASMCSLAAELHSQSDDQPRRIPRPSRTAAADTLRQSVPDDTSSSSKSEAVTLAPAASAKSDTLIIWHQPYISASSRARNERKQLLIVVEAEWSPWSKAMSESTWTDQRILAFAKTVIFTRVDADIDTAVISQYRVNRIPTAILATDQGAEIDRFVGYMPPDEMLEELRRGMEGDGTMWDLDRKLNESRNDAKVMVRIAHEFRERGELERAREYLDKARNADPDGAQGMADDVLFLTAQLERDKGNWYKALEPLKQLVKKFPESEWREDAEIYIGWLYEQAGDEKEAIKKYNEFLKEFASSTETQWVKRQVAELEEKIAATSPSTQTEGKE